MRWLLTAAGGVALVGALLLVTAPRGEVERVVPVLTVEDAAPVEARIVVDTDRGEIRAGDERLAAFVRVPGVRMALRGTSGDGPVAIRVRDPDGAVVIEDAVAPRAAFDLSEDIASDVDVAVTATPASLPAPGGEVEVRLELRLRRDAAAPAELVWAETWSPWLTGPFGPEREHPGAMETLAVLGAPGPEGCGQVLAELPVPLTVDTPLTCTFLVEVAGEAGEEVAGELSLLVDTGDLVGTVPGAAVTIALIEPGGDPADGGTGAPSAEAADTELAAAPLHARLEGDAGGVYEIEVDAPAGSPGLSLELEWFEPAPPVGPVLGGLWIVAGLVALVVGLLPAGIFADRATVVARVAAGLVGLAGMAVIVTLYVTADRSGLLIVGGAHGWYWTRGFVGLAVTTLLLVPTGALLASPGASRRWGGGLGLPMLIGGAAVAALAVAVGIAGYAFGTEGATYYAGDYLTLALHLQALVLAGVLLAAGGLLRGTPAPPAPSPPGPPASGPRPRRRELTGPRSG